MTTRAAVFAREPRKFPRGSRAAKLPMTWTERQVIYHWNLMRGRTKERTPPTHAELGSELNRDESTVRRHLHSLARKGWLRILAHQARGVRVA